MNRIRSIGLRQRDPDASAGFPRGRSGASLVELMVSVLLIFIIFCGWARINNIQAVRKESFRYAAVEKAAGILDAFDANVPNATRVGYYFICKVENGKIEFQPQRSGEPSKIILRLESDDANSPIGYQMYISSEAPEGWGTGIWATIDLFDTYLVPRDQARPFTSLRVLVSRQ